jgi:DNA mismatch endonuclease, patch repair protein
MPLRRTPHQLLTSSQRPPAISAARSVLMASVRQRGTSPELVVRQLAKRLKIHFQTNGKHLPGSPDLFTVQPKRALFVHGCFWHRHSGCKATTTPKSHQTFWLEKFRANLQRDRRKIRNLRYLGFRIMTVWECQVKARKNLDRIAGRLVRFFRAG